VIKVMSAGFIDVNTQISRVSCNDTEYACAIGRAGAIDKTAKREGDGATPRGRYPVRYVYWRPDRLARPQTGIETRELSPASGWCDDPADIAYNRAVSLPYRARAEALWRGDQIYDLILVIGHNDDPPVAGLGSAIFVHIARENYAATEGCVALKRIDLLALLENIGPQTVIRID
jgi:L,D-peptidoglycan transpeptidase YkuD (ErfK/YbiS/YcfS/YnhG family)